MSNQSEREQQRQAELQWQDRLQRTFKSSSIDSIDLINELDLSKSDPKFELLPQVLKNIDTHQDAPKNFGTFVALLAGILNGGTDTGIYVEPEDTTQIEKPTNSLPAGHSISIMHAHGRYRWDQETAWTNGDNIIVTHEFPGPDGKPEIRIVHVVQSVRRDLHGQYHTKFTKPSGLDQPFQPFIFKNTPAIQFPLIVTRKPISAKFVGTRTK